METGGRRALAPPQRQSAPLSQGNPIEWKPGVGLSSNSQNRSRTPLSQGNPIEWKPSRSELRLICLIWLPSRRGTQLNGNRVEFDLYGLIRLGLPSRRGTQLNGNPSSEVTASSAKPATLPSRRGTQLNGNYR